MLYKFYFIFVIIKAFSLFIIKKDYARMFLIIKKQSSHFFIILKIFFVC